MNENNFDEFEKKYAALVKWWASLPDHFRHKLIKSLFQQRLKGTMDQKQIAIEILEVEKSNSIKKSDLYDICYKLNEINVEYFNYEWLTIHNFQFLYGLERIYLSEYDIRNRLFASSLRRIRRKKKVNVIVNWEATIDKMGLGNLSYFLSLGALFALAMLIFVSLFSIESISWLWSFKYDFILLIPILLPLVLIIGYFSYYRLGWKATPIEAFSNIKIHGGLMVLVMISNYFLMRDEVEVWRGLGMSMFFIIDTIAVLFVTLIVLGVVFLLGYQSFVRINKTKEK